MYLKKLKKPLLALRIGLLALLLILFLPACTSPTKYVRELPPPDLLADCPVVVEQHDTNGDLAWTILEYRKALAQCNTDKGSLRKWAN